MNASLIVPLPADGRKWRVFSKTTSDNIIYIEAAPEGQHPNNPRETITIIRTITTKPLREACDHVVSTLSPRNGLGEFHLHARKAQPDGECFHWSIRNDLVDAGRTEIQRLFTAGPFLFNVVYTRRIDRLPMYEMGDWIDRISSLQAIEGSFDSPDFEQQRWGGPAQTERLQQIVKNADRIQVDRESYARELREATDEAYCFDHPLLWSVARGLLCRLTCDSAGREVRSAGDEERKIDSAIADARQALFLAKQMNAADAFEMGLDTLCGALSLSCSQTRSLDLQNCFIGLQHLYKLAEQRGDANAVAALVGRMLQVTLSLASDSRGQQQKEAEQAAEEMLAALANNPNANTQQTLESLNGYGALCIQRGERHNESYFVEALHMFDALQRLLEMRTIDQKTGIGFFGLAAAGQREALLGMAGIDPAMVAAQCIAEMNSLPGMTFLRPLNSSRRLLMPNRFSHFDRRDLPFRFPREPRLLSLEGALHCNTVGCFAAVTVGGPMEGVGMGRTQILPPTFVSDVTDASAIKAAADDETWKGVVDVLLKINIVHFLLVSPTDGVCWEVDQLRRRNLLAQTVFIMIPEEIESASPALWRDARKRYVSAGVQLPEYSPDGAFISLLADGKVRWQLPFDALWDGRLVAKIREDAVALLKEMLASAEQRADTEEVTQLQMKISALLRASAQFDEAIELRQRALDYRRSLPDKEKLATLLADMGLLLEQAGQPKAALPHLEEARALFTEIGTRNDDAGVKALDERLLRVNGS